MYVYILNQEGNFDVGFYDPNGVFVVESTIVNDSADKKKQAAARVSYLNGSGVIASDICLKCST